jgi:hypothetical protein
MPIRALPGTLCAETDTSYHERHGLNVYLELEGELEGEES